MARHRRRGRWANQAALEALLRFGPELSGLNELQRTTRQQYRGSVRNARQAARGTVLAVRAARPQVRDIYSDASGTARRANRVLGDLTGVPASMQAAIAQEQAGFRSRLAEERADALVDLTSRSVGAREGRGAAIRAARGQLGTDLGKILRRKIDLARERGAFTALRAGELRSDAAQRRQEMQVLGMRLSQQERSSIRSAGLDPDTGRPIPGGRLDPDANRRPGDQRPRGRGGSSGGRGRGRATNAQIGAAQDAAQMATSWARRLSQAGLSRADVASLLSSGREGRPVYRNVNGRREPVLNRDGTQKTTRDVPAIKSQLLLSAALDQVFNGYVTPRVAHRLHARGLRVRRDLGLRTVQQWRRRNRRRHPPHGGRPSQGAAGYPYGPGAGQVH